MASGRVPIKQRMVFSVAIAVALAGDCMEASVFYPDYGNSRIFMLRNRTGEPSLSRQR